MKKTVEIYTDGACSGNPGPGGWGAILCYKGKEREFSGGEAQTTNNRMELTAVISALRALKEPCRVELYSDSKYVVDALEKGWAKSWRRRGWVRNDKQPALNPDLWEELLGLTEQHELHCHWVKGHASNTYNNRCDALAVAQRDKYAKKPKGEQPMSGPIYVPRGAAKEYGDYALNLYTGCPHRCYYCFAPGVLHKTREEFHSYVVPRRILTPLERQLATGEFAGKTIHLCFTCDPYPVGVDTSVTREAIRLIKGAGGHVQILTKGDGSRDLDLLDGSDWYGITLTGADLAAEPHAETPLKRFMALKAAKERGVKTWISFEPVINENAVFEWLGNTVIMQYVDRVKIGKLNYHPSTISMPWHDFGIIAETLCQKLGLDYYIKDSLRKEMETDQPR